MRPRMYGSTLMNTVAHEHPALAGLGQLDARRARSPRARARRAGAARVVSPGSSRARTIGSARHGDRGPARRGHGRGRAASAAPGAALRRRGRARRRRSRTWTRRPRRRSPTEVGGLAVTADVGREEDIRALSRAPRRPTARSTCSSPTPASRARSGGPPRCSTRTGTCCGASTRWPTCGRRARCCPGCSSAARATSSHRVGGGPARPARRARLHGHQARGGRGRRVAGR